MLSTKMLTSKKVWFQLLSWKFSGLKTKSEYLPGRKPDQLWFQLLSWKFSGIKTKSEYLPGRKPEQINTALFSLFMLAGSAKAYPLNLLGRVITTNMIHFI